MRQIVLDTETTGLGHDAGHRIIEIGCVELVNRKLTNRHFHTYLNPERKVDEGAFRVHGISDAFLLDKPVFKEVAQDFLQFIDQAELIIHNAPFDVGFINAELKHLKHQKRLDTYCSVFDTLVLAKQKHPGQRNSLDALCKRYDVDNSNRQLHGALLDAEILALVYLAMTGGQTHLFVEDVHTDHHKKTTTSSQTLLSTVSPVFEANAAEMKAHDEFIQFIVKKSGVDHWSE
ncbi:DNA polymerase III subunit epsilon [bacterium]|nr:DNA polymerase III subunit epsilon [bacterium]